MRLIFAAIYTRIYMWLIFYSEHLFRKEIHIWPKSLLNKIHLFSSLSRVNRIKFSSSESSNNNGMLNTSSAPTLPWIMLHMYYTEPASEWIPVRDFTARRKGDRERSLLENGKSDYLPCDSSTKDTDNQMETNSIRDEAFYMSHFGVFLAVTV